MKARDIVATLSVAVATVVVTMALARPARVAAIDEGARVRDEIRPMISRPEMEIDGLHVKLTLDKPSYEAGDAPELTVEATNPTRHRIETKVWLGITSSTVKEMLSRSPTRPDYIWAQTCPVTVEPGATRTIRIVPGKKLVAGNMVSVTMGENDQRAAVSKLVQLRTAVADGPSNHHSGADTSDIAAAKSHVD